ncbi:MAG: hypothetical protein F6K47_42775 [Symploca sp. SIO2E6]|nr:hypothetical protein [Symploca sp. SIO2E6]
MQLIPNFQAMSRQELMQYLEKNFDERALQELEKRPIPQSIIDEHNSFLNWKAQQKQQVQ